MGSRKSPLEQLITLSPAASGLGRRELLRELTNALLAAPSRYTIKEMQYFDLLFSRSSQIIEKKIGRIFAMALTKSNAPKELTRKLLLTRRGHANSITRRSAVLSAEDLLMLISERATQQFRAPIKKTNPTQALRPENRYTLPPAILAEMFRFHYFSLRHELSASVSDNILSVLERTAKRFEPAVIEQSMEEAREEVIAARKVVMEKNKIGGLDEEALIEFLETRQMTEFTFGLGEATKTDPATTQRILNDQSWENMAIACRAAGITRATFAKFLYGMQSRQSDEENILRIIGLYNKIETDAAERVMRFWQVRANSFEEDSILVRAAPGELPPMANDDTPTEINNATPTFGKQR